MGIDIFHYCEYFANILLMFPKLLANTDTNSDI